jgi:hypothetical protein
MMKFTKVLLAATLVAGTAHAAQTQRRPAAAAPAATTAPAYTSTSSLNNAQWALGWNRVSLGSGAQASALHLRVDAAARTQVGLNFGFVDNFNSFLIAPDIRYTFGSHEGISPFVEALVGFSHISGGGGSVNNLEMNFLGGLNWAVTSRFHVSLAYGVEVSVIDSNSVSFTQPIFGNFGVHWLL